MATHATPSIYHTPYPQKTNFRTDWYHTGKPMFGVFEGRPYYMAHYRVLYGVCPGPDGCPELAIIRPNSDRSRPFLGFRVLYSFMKRLVVVPASIFGWRVAIKDLTYGNDDELESWVVNLVLATPTKRPQRSCESQGLYSIDQG